jgi:probable HAF family extracellular repeat protein
MDEALGGGKRSSFRMFSKKLETHIRTISIKADETTRSASVKALGSAAPAYNISAVEPPGGLERSRCLGISNSGRVVGRFYNWNESEEQQEDRQAFIWDKTNGSLLLSTLSGESSAWGVNDVGLVSGFSYNTDGYERAVRWDSTNNAIIDIGALTNTNPDPDVVGNTSCSYDLNNSGRVVGMADIPNDDETFIPFHAFLYDESTGIHDLGTLRDDQPYYQNGYSIAYDINNSQKAVGVASGTDWFFFPFIYDEINGMQELNRNPAYISGEEWHAVVINDSGLIGGHVIPATNQSLPHYWVNSFAVPVQVTMPALFPYGEIYGVNAQGQMVGIMWDSDLEDATEHAFIFDMENGARDLNDLIDPASGWVLTFARDINDAGQIVGYGEFNGEKRGFILDPIKRSMPWIPMLLLDN